MAVLVVANPASQQEKAHPPVAASSILSRLRLETRAEHEAVEQVLDLMSDSLTRPSYRLRLEQFYGFYAPLENALQARAEGKPNQVGELTLSPATRLALAGRLHKTVHLQQDLQYLGVTGETLRLCCDLPPLGTQADVLGCLYVMEGATLGGRMITRHISAALGVTPATGGSFFEGYGEDTARMWQGMRQLLVSSSPDTQTENTMVISAITTFACLRSWCETFVTTGSKRYHP